MMPSSPDPTPQPWQPAEFGDQPAPPSTEVLVANRLALFELDTAAGIPPTVLAPARKAAEAAGYAAGWAVGTREAQHEAAEREIEARVRMEREAAAGRARIGSAVAALTAAADFTAAATAPELADLETLIVDAAFTIAEALVQTNLRNHPDRGHAAVLRALAMTPAGAAVTVALHPADHATLTEYDLGPDVTIVADPMLAPGDAVATCDVTVVDARISAGIDRVREVLGKP
jgi:flagellar assembly protein FliH